MTHLRSGYAEMALQFMKESCEDRNPDKGPGLLDAETGASAELRNLRLLVHDAIERTEMAPVSLKEDLTHAFSEIRTTINAAVQQEHLRNGCLDAVDDCEKKCRYRLTVLHAQHLSFLQELIGHENGPPELQQSWAKRKKAEFEELRRIPDLNFMTDYPKIPDGTVTADFSRSRPGTAPVWQKETAHVGSVNRKKLEYKFPKPWDACLPGRGEGVAPRPNSVQDVRTDHGLSPSVRPASAMGISQGGHVSGRYDQTPARPRTPSAAAMVGVKTVVVPHAIPNLKAGLMPTSVDQWPARTTTLQSADIFLGEGAETGDAVPARGYKNASVRFNACLQTNLPTRLNEPQFGSTRRPMTAKPADMDKIERFIDIEFQKSKCQMDEFNPKRLEIFSRALDSVTKTFTTWAPLLKTIKREYDTYVSQLEVQNEQGLSLKQQLLDMEKDYSQKFEDMREDTSQVVKRVQAEAERTVQDAEQKVHEQLERKAALEEELAKEKRVTENLSKKLPEVESQLQILLRAYNENLKDCRKIMEASRCASVGELCEMFRSMVHIQAMTEVEQRLGDEKKQIVEERDRWHDKFDEMQDQCNKAKRSKSDFESRYMHMVRENDVMCKFFIAQFPEAEDLRLINGKLCLADEDGKNAKEVSLKVGLKCLRNRITQLHRDFEALKCSHDKLHTQLVEILQGNEDADVWTEREYFDGLGEDPNIPELLQYTGKVKNKHLPMGQVEKSVKQMLEKHKKEEERKAGKDVVVELPDVWTLMHAHAQTISKSRSAQVEWAYSFRDALQKFSRDKFILKVFYDMLEGRAVPAVWFEAESIPTNLFEKAQAKDKEQRTNGRMPRRTFQLLVEAFFKPQRAQQNTKGAPAASIASGHIKDKIAMEELFRKLKTDEIAGCWGVTAKEVEIKKLFQTSKDGSKSCFVMGLMEQFVADRSLYLMDLILHLRRCRAPRTKETSSENLKASLKAIDPWKPESEVNAIVKSVFGAHPRDHKIQNADFEKRLKGVHTRRSTSRTLDRVAHALRPKSAGLQSALKKMKQVLLLLRIIKCFQLAGLDFRKKRV